MTRLIRRIHNLDTSDQWQTFIIIIHQHLHPLTPYKSEPDHITFQHSLVFLSRVMGFITLLFSLLLLQDGSQGQLLEVESVVAHEDHNEQHRLEPGLTTYQCQGWSDIPTTIYLTSPHRPIGMVQFNILTGILYF